MPCKLNREETVGLFGSSSNSICFGWVRQKTQKLVKIYILCGGYFSKCLILMSRRSLVILNIKAPMVWNLLLEELPNLRLSQNNNRLGRDMEKRSETQNIYCENLPQASLRFFSQLRFLVLYRKKWESPSGRSQGETRATTKRSVFSRYLIILCARTG